LSNIGCGGCLERHLHTVPINLLYLKQRHFAILEHVIIVDDLDPIADLEIAAGVPAQRRQHGAVADERLDGKHDASILP